MSFQLFMESAKALQPIPRPAEAEEIARSILFLASDDARMITGIQHIVDGGFHLAGSQPQVDLSDKLQDATASVL